LSIVHYPLSITHRPLPPSEPIVWQGRPSALVDLPFYLLLLCGAVLASLGLLYALPAAEVGPRATDNAHLFRWVLAGVWVLVVVLALARWIARRATHYVLTTERLRITTGLLSTTTEDIELRRVRDSSVVRPLFLRLVGLGDVRVVSADPSTPRVTLHAVRDPDGLQHTLRGLVEGLIRRHGVREIDVM
jgi:membrane protein YdbS with pleckstrin-like domain